MSAHSSSLKAANKAIKKHGRDIILRDMIETGPAYDPTLTPNDLPTKGVFDSYDDNELKKDRKVLIYADPVADATMKLVDDGTEFEIVSVEQVRPGDLLIMQILQVRG